MKHVYIEQHGDQSLIKLTRDNRTIAGITAKGVIVTVKGAIDDLTDDEMLELMSIPPGTDPKAMTYDDFKDQHDRAASSGNSPNAPFNRSKIGETFDYFDIGQELALTESFWLANPKLNRSVRVDKVYINKFYGENHDTIEIAIEHNGRKFTTWVSRELAYEMRYIWNLEHK